MKILILSREYPNNQDPVKGIYVKERVESLKKICDIKVVSPVPWFPSIKLFKKYYFYSQISKKRFDNNVEIFYPRYLVIPKLFILQVFSYFISVFVKIKQIQKQFNFDIINAHFAYPDGVVAVLVAKLLKKPVIVTLQGIDVDVYIDSFIVGKMIRYTLKNANKIIAVSNAQKRKIINYGISKKNIRVINGGADPQKFRPLNNLKLRNLLGFPINKKIIISIGRLSEEKGFHVLISAMSKINQTNKDVLLVIIGGPVEGKYYKKLNRLVEHHNLKKNVIFVGYKSHEQIPLYLNLADIFCLASFREGFPTVIAEAVACGKPVVATSVGGIPEIIGSEDYGFLVPPGNPQNLANVLVKALKKRWNYKKIVDYSKKYNWKDLVREEYVQFQKAIKNEI